MVDFALGLADWAVKQAANTILSQYVKEGKFTPAEETTVDAAVIDILNLGLQLTAEKVGAGNGEPS